MNRDDHDMMLRADLELKSMRKELDEYQEGMKTMLGMVQEARDIVKGQIAAFAAQALPIPPAMVVSALIDLETALGGEESANDEPQGPKTSDTDWSA